MMQDLISRGVDGISVAPSNATAMAKFIDQAIEAGIPVVTFNSDSPDSSAPPTLAPATTKWARSWR